MTLNISKLMPINPIVISDDDLGTPEGLQTVVARMISYKSNFYELFKVTYKSSAFIQFETRDAQVLYLKNIVGRINRCDLNYDEEMASLPIAAFDIKSEMEHNPVLYQEVKKYEAIEKGPYLYLLFLSPKDDVITVCTSSFLALRNRERVRSDETTLKDSLDIAPNESVDLFNYIDEFFPKNGAIADYSKLNNILADKPCGNCKKISCKKKCSKCFVIYYCNGDCQAKDWQRHKIVCKNLRKIIMLSYFDKAKLSSFKH